MQSSVILQRLQTGETFHTLTAAHPMTNLAFSPKGEYLATIGEEPCIRLWDVSTGLPLQKLDLDDPSSVAHCFSPDGSMLAAGGGNGELKVWTITEGPKPQFELQFAKREHWAPVTSICFSPDSKQLVSVGYDHRIIVWDSKSGKLLKEPWLGGRRELDCVTYNPAGTRLVSACHDGTLTIWDSTNFQEILVLRDHDYAPLALAFSSDGQTLYSGGDGQKVHVWDGSPWDPAPEQNPVVLKAFDTPIINAIAIKPDGSELAAGGEDGFVKTFQLPSGDTTKVLGAYGTFGVVFDLAYESTGPHLFSIGAGGDVTRVVQRWNTVTVQDVPPRVKQDSRNAFCLAIAPGGGQLVVGGALGVIDVYETSGETPIGHLGDRRRPIVDLVFSPNGRFLVSATDEREIKLWDAQRLNESQDGETIWNCRGSTVFHMGFDRQGITLALGDGNDILLYDVEAPEDSHRLKSAHGDSVNAVAFSHNDQFLASGSSDGTVKLWNAKTYVLVKTFLVGHGVYNIAFTPDDAWLATAGYDTDVKLWNLSSLNDTQVGVEESN